MIGSFRSGLTLIEVLLTMAIAAMVLAALSQLQGSGVLAATRAALTAEASVISQSELDAWLASGQPASALGRMDTVRDMNNWTRRISIKPLPNRPNSRSAYPLPSFNGEQDARGTRENGASELSVLTVEVFHVRQREPVFTLLRWIATPNARATRSNSFKDGPGSRDRSQGGPK